jgi:hypothetical protein
VPKILVMTELLLYTTSHCHLCEQAEALLTELTERHMLRWQAIEISNDDHLMLMYGTRIPVIKIKNKLAELGWPFTTETVMDFIEKN